MTSTYANPADTIVVPRGAQWAADIFAAILNAAGSLIARAPVAQATPTDHERIRQAARVRRMADQWRAADPRFAAELYAAADRHEIGG